jgi:hypothetical protein
VVTRDPFEILGIAQDATMAEAKAAYRRLAELFHPDRLQGVRDDVRAEGEQRMREITDAMRVVRSRLGRPLVAPGHERSATGDARSRRTRPRTRARHDDPTTPTTLDPSLGGRPAPKPSDAATDAEARDYDVQLRTAGGANLHVRWSGRHAAATLAALRHGHRIDGLIRQVEWGSYEVELDGAATRRLLRSVLHDDEWRHETVEVLRLEPGAGPPLPARPDDVREGAVLDLGDLLDLLDDRRRYSVLADVY